MNGDDDETQLSRTTDPVVRGELEQEQRLVNDLIATGSAFLADRDVTAVPLSAHERIPGADPVQRLRVVAATTAPCPLAVMRGASRVPT